MTVREKTGWVWDALKGRATVEMNWSLKRRQRWWYTLKAIVCVAFGWEDNRSIWDRPLEDPDHVEITFIDFHRYSHHEFGDAADWTYLAVGHGIRRYWYFTIGYTGYP